MDPCASPILIGLDILVQLDSVTDYKSQMITFNYEDNVISTQLYSKEEIEKSADSVENINEPVFKFTEDNLNEYFTNRSIPLNDVEKAAITELLLENKDLFATSFNEMLGIKNSDYAIELLDSNVSPIKAKLKRYTTQERDVIKQEIDKMLEAKIIEPSFAPWCSPIKIVPKPAFLY